MENGRCSCGLLRAYPPPPVSSPTRGKGVGSGWETGSPGMEPGIPACCWASPFVNPLPCLNWEGGPSVFPAGVGSTRPDARELGCTDVGSDFEGCPDLAMCFCLTLPFPRPSASKQVSPLLSFTSASHVLFRVQCSVWLSSHQVTVGSTDKK